MDSQEPRCSEAKTACKYGSECYRKNPQHLRDFIHPGDEEEDEKYGCPSVKRVAVDSSLGREPPPFYVTKVRGISDHYNSSALAIGLKDILAMGELLASAQFNYMFDVPWLLEQYPAHKKTTPLLLVHGEQGGGLAQLRMASKPFSHISLFQAPLKIPYGTHHSKMMLLLFGGGMRVVIHTANLVEKDWDQKTQGVWISPLFPKEPSDPSTFQKDLLNYLGAYGESAALDVWKRHIREHNMGTARVHLIASVPGSHIGSSVHIWGHMKLRKVLSEHGPPASRVGRDWMVVGQFSSVGSLGPSSHQWLCSEWLTSLSTCRAVKTLGPQNFPPLQLIFPTVENVRNSLEGYMAGGSIPYDQKVAEKQPYLTGYLCQWKAEHCGRSQAAPHIKTYGRVSPDHTQLAWFLVTSANLSKAAWGAFEKKGSQLKIRSYEIGVLFLPDKDAFLSVSTHLSTSPGSLLLPYDLPLTQYSKKDRPWMWNGTYTEPDSHGRIWTPP